MVTGSKGGGGKTPVAASIALALHALKVPIIACDFNFNNHDLLTIFHGMNVLERKSKGWDKEYVFGVDPFWRIDTRFWLTRWRSTSDLGIPSTVSMWQKIRELSQVEFPVGSEPKVMIFDTNLTIPLLCPPPTQLQEFQDIPDIEVWHLWSPAIVLQLEEQERFTRAIDLLKRVNPGFEDRMTHVFTPRHHQASGFFGTFTSLARGEFSVTKSLKFKQANPKPITFSEMKSVLFADFFREILNYRSYDEIDIDELLARWLEGIIKNLEEREYLTNNVLIVPTVVHNIALLVEKLVLKPRRTLESTREDLGRLYEIIKSHFEIHRAEFIKELGGFEN